MPLKPDDAVLPRLLGCGEPRQGVRVFWNGCVPSVHPPGLLRPEKRDAFGRKHRKTEEVVLARQLRGNPRRSQSLSSSDLFDDWQPRRVQETGAPPRVSLLVLSPELICTQGEACTVLGELSLPSTPECVTDHTLALSARSSIQSSTERASDASVVRRSRHNSGTCPRR